MDVSGMIVSYTRLAFKMAVVFMGSTCERGLYDFLLAVMSLNLVQNRKQTDRLFHLPQDPAEIFIETYANNELHLD
jgi:hypothetical protein